MFSQNVNTRHFEHIRLLSTDAGRGRFLERSISDELAVIERHQGPQVRRLRNQISSEVEITEVRPRPPAVLMDIDRLAAIEPLPPKKGSVSRSCTIAKKAKAAAAKANAKGGKADAKGDKAAAAAVPKANAKGCTAAAAVPKANAKGGKAAAVQKTNAKGAKAAKAVKAKKVVAAAKAAVKAVVAAAVGGDKKPLKMEAKNIKCRAYRAAERKATHEGLSIEEIIEARTNAYAEASLPE
jgi:hypothetical protein